MPPRKSGKIGSSSSEGNNKFFSSKRRIPILKMVVRIINKIPKSRQAKIYHGDEIQSQIRVVYRMILLISSMPSLNLDALL